MVVMVVPTDGGVVGGEDHLGAPSGEGVRESGEERREEEGELRSISSTYLHPA